MNKIKIDAGQWRSRVLSFPDDKTLRPTPLSVRQTLFNWLGQDLSQKICLDLFSGSGSLGFEALSRGADEVIFVEQSLPAYRALKKNQALLCANHAKIICQPAEVFLLQNQQKFDVIFLDPPFHQNLVMKFLPCVLLHLKDNGVVYVESECDLALAESASGICSVKPVNFEKDDLTKALSQNWQIIKQGRRGAVFYHLIKNGVSYE